MRVSFSENNHTCSSCYEVVSCYMSLIAVRGHVRYLSGSFNVACKSISLCVTVCYIVVHSI